MNDDRADISPVEHEVRPTLRECVAEVMAHQWSNNRRAMDALTRLVDAAIAAADDLDRLTPKTRGPMHSCDDPLCAVCGHPWA